MSGRLRHLISCFFLVYMVDRSIFGRDPFFSRTRRRPLLKRSCMRWWPARCRQLGSLKRTLNLTLVWRLMTIPLRSVLDPSMFVRFNDGVLQASLLRASRPAELDYSASDDLSRQFALTGLSVFGGCRDQVGEAALEFVHAVATEKVSLRKTDRC